MPTAQLPGNLRLYYEDDNFTDPWAVSYTHLTLPTIYSV